MTTKVTDREVRCGYQGHRQRLEHCDKPDHRERRRPETDRLGNRRRADVALVATTGTRTAGTSVTATTTTAGDTYQVTGTRTATGAGTVTCAGLFDNNTMQSGSMFLAGDFTGIGLAINDSISFTIKAVFDN